jgi:hypothetical protein
MLVNIFFSSLFSIFILVCCLAKRFLGLVRFSRKSKLEMRGLIFSMDALLEQQPLLFFVVEQIR